MNAELCNARIAITVKKSGPRPQVRGQVKLSSVIDIPTEEAGGGGVTPPKERSKGGWYIQTNLNEILFHFELS